MLVKFQQRYKNQSKNIEKNCRLNRVEKNRKQKQENSHTYSSLTYLSLNVKKGWKGIVYKWCHNFTQFFLNVRLRLRFSILGKVEKVEKSSNLIGHTLYIFLAVFKPLSHCQIFEIEIKWLFLSLILIMSAQWNRSYMGKIPLSNFV